MYPIVSSSHLAKTMNTNPLGILKLPFTPSDALCDIVAELSLYNVDVNRLLIAAIKTLHQVNPTDIDYFLKWFEQQMFESDGTILRYFEYIGAQPYDVFEYTFDMFCTELTPITNTIRSNIHIPRITSVVGEYEHYILLECQ